MNRNDKCINKVINYQKEKAGSISEGIFKTFKKIFYDIKAKQYSDKIKEKPDHFFELSLGNKKMQYYITMAFDRFKNFTKKGENENDYNEDYIEIKDELKYFLKSLGNRLDDQDIDFMLHLIINFDKDRNELTQSQICDIWGAILAFSKFSPQEIIYDVLNYYYESRAGILDTKDNTTNELDVSNLE